MALEWGVCEGACGEGSIATAIDEGTRGMLAGFDKLPLFSSVKTGIEWNEGDRVISGGEGGAGRAERLTVERCDRRGDAGARGSDDETERESMVEGEYERGGGVMRLYAAEGEEVGEGEEGGELVEERNGESDREGAISAEGTCARWGIGETTEETACVVEFFDGGDSFFKGIEYSKDII